MCVCVSVCVSLVPVRLSSCGSFKNSLMTHTNEGLKTRRPSGALEHCALVPLMNVSFRRLSSSHPSPSIQKKSSALGFSPASLADPPRCMLGKLHSVTHVSNESE